MCFLHCARVTAYLHNSENQPMNDWMNEYLYLSVKLK